MHTAFRHLQTVAAAAALLLGAATLRAAAPVAAAAAEGSAAIPADNLVISESMAKPVASRPSLFERTASSFSFHLPTELRSARAQAFGMAPYFGWTQAETLGSFPALHTIGSPSPVSGMLGLAHQFALIGPVRRFAETDRWNTSDSSRPNDFALCYRISRIMGFQIIPGDLTPSKLPTPKMLSVKTYGNGMGVMAGLTLRIGKH